MPDARMELHWGRLMRCYVERPPTLDAMFRAAVAADADAEAVVDGSIELTYRDLERRLNVTVKRPNIFGDVSWVRGTVVDKRVEDGVHLAELGVRIENQLGDVTADGTSIVELPTRTRS